MDPLLSFLFLELRLLSLAVSFRRIFFDSLVSILRENFDREREKENEDEPFRRRFDSGEFMSGR